MKRFILFDHDGVLVDTERWYFAALQRTLAGIGLSVDKERYLQDMADGAGSWTQARAAGVDAAALAELKRIRNAHYQEYLRVESVEIDGARQVLERLSGRVQMAIVTTSKRADFELIHRNSRILPFMEFALVREDFDNPKPDPEPYMRGLARFGARPSETLVVEDSARGLRSAIAAGIDCAVVHSDFTATHDFTGATHRIGSLLELEGILG